MVKPVLVANSLALTVFAFQAVLIIEAFLFPGFFAWEYKALTMGQNTAFVNPTGQEAVITAVIPVIEAWIIGFFWASVYNYLTKKGN